MNNINLIFFFALCFIVNITNDNYKDFDIESIKLNSYVFYEYGGPGFPIGDTPALIKFEIKCKNSNLDVYEIRTLSHNKGIQIKKTRVEISMKKYLKFWEKILMTDLWNLKTVTPINLLTEEDLFREYKKLRMEEDNNKFEFRLGKMSNKFEVYDLPMVKNPDYLFITSEIIALFNRDLIDLFFFE